MTATWRQTPLPLLLLALLVSGCAKHTESPQGSPASIGPYSEFTGRLIVIETTRRWQTTLEWKAESPEQGWLRLTHAATGTVVEFRWLHDLMQVRDNTDTDWKQINQYQLSQQGIVLPPRQLASVLLGNMPDHFKQRKPHNWESLASGSLIQLKWDRDTQRLMISDIQHGRRATLIIQP